MLEASRAQDCQHRPRWPRRGTRRPDCQDEPQDGQDEAQDGQDEGQDCQDGHRVGSKLATGVSKMGPVAPSSSKLGKFWEILDHQVHKYECCKIKKTTNGFYWFLWDQKPHVGGK